MLYIFRATVTTSAIAVACLACSLQEPRPAEPSEHSAAALELMEGTSLKWNRIAWNRIAWNSISSAEHKWHELRVGPLASTSLPSAGPDPRLKEALLDEHVRAVLGYIVECALPPSSELHFDDLNGEPLTFTGLHGLAPTWENQACDVSCQRSVTACLLARVNYFGERNLMAWRRGSGIPENEHTAAMENPSTGVKNSFHLEEGAVWGNIFQTEPEIHTCRGVDSVAQVSLLNIDVEAYGGAVPMAAMRMCYGDQDCLDEVYAGPCGGTDAVCQERRANGGYHGCAAADGDTYTEVITIHRANFDIHADFIPGHSLDPALSSCAAEVADLLPACRDDWHDETCAALALDECGSHSVYESGLPLDRHANLCTAYVCALDSFCCEVLWDQKCTTDANDLCK
ncbi:hypothetical protein [Haliangium sp.]|uniref:hypothetical protein n=1 Tax=Haliangium sp. TaxID=2663208 RepID=UPI003D109D97